MDDRTLIQNAIAQRDQYNAELRGRCEKLLHGPHGHRIDVILTHIAPYVGLDVAAMPVHMLACDIIVLLTLLEEAS